VKVALVTGLCQHRDAISNAVMAEREVLVAAGHEVTVFTHFTDRLAGDEVVVIVDPWKLQQVPAYRDADVVVFHYGIQYELFNALLLGHPRAALVVRFHNVTPPALLDGDPAAAAARAIDQISIADRAHVVWSDSRHNTDVLVTHADVERDQVRLLPLCVPMVEAEPRPRVVHPRLRIQSVGRFVRAKGADILVEAYGALDPTVRAGTELVLIGSSRHSDRDHLDALEARIAGLGIAEQVELRFDVTDDELHASYAGADVFVSPSHHEGFCIPVIEALANDCVVVTSDAGALPDTVGSFGDVVPAGDFAALAAALGRAVTEARDPDRAAGAPARRVARAPYLAQFGPTRFAARLLDELHRAANLASPFAGDPPRRDAARFAERHGRLLSRLTCPECRGRLIVASLVEAHGTVAEAELVCATHGRRGVVDSFRPGFLPRCLDRWDARPRGVIDDSLDLVRDTETRGEWRLIREGLVCSGQAGETLTFETGAPGFEVRFHGHARSGRVEIRVDGQATNVADLYRYEPGEVIVDSGPLGTGPHQVELVALGPAAVPERSHVIVARIVRRSGADEARVPNLAARNRGNPYPERFAKLLVDVPTDGLVLDCGGGDRRFGDDRVINLEYLDYDLVDIYGDGLALPFADGAFDLVMSQAVLEHVPDPQAAVDEMVRLLQPGGVLYVEVAFMQPVHAVPYHFMNVTPHGLAHLCRALEVEDSGTFGGLEVTMGWFVDLLDARRRVGGDRVEHMLATLRDLDATLSPSDLAQLASAVHLTGRKPVGG
jgi:glycosyltransferase involved in cell wall biosynthesis/SAM-dependent methyltransferase